MSTKKFKLGSASGNNVKGGKNNTRTILTAAGVVAFGATTGGGGYVAGAALGPHTPEEENPEQTPEVNTEETPETQSAQQSETIGSQQTAQQTQPQSADNITGPHPTDSNQPQPVGNNQHQSNSNDVHQPTADNPEEVDPNLVAQHIVEEQNIDPYDIDSPTIISVDELTTRYGADGSEMLVAVVHTPDGTQYLLADVDGDGYFTDVFDMSGIYVGEADGNLMASDLEIMVNPDGGYIAQTGDEPQGDDPTNDIINTSSPAHNDIAENSIITSSLEEDDITDEELLAQLIEDAGGEDELLIDDSDDDSDDDPDDDIDEG